MCILTHPKDDIMQNPSMKCHHLPPWPNCDWSGAGLWVWFWLLTDRADPKRYAIQNASFWWRWGNHFGVKLEVREREWLITIPFVQLCWFTSPCCVPQRPADTQHACIHPSSAHACVSVTCSHLHVRTKAYRKRSVWSIPEWTEESLMDGFFSLPYGY